MSEKAPLGLGSNFDSSETENEKPETGSLGYGDITKKYGRSLAILGMLAGAPALDQSAGAQSFSSVIDSLNKLGDTRFHEGLKERRELADAYEKEVQTLIEGGRDSIGAELSLGMVKDLGKFKDKYNFPGLDGKRYYLFEKMGSKEDLITLREIFMDTKASVLKISEFYEIDKGSNKGILDDSINKFDELLNALDKVIESK